MGDLRVAFVNPPSYGYSDNIGVEINYGLLSIATVVKKAGHEILYLDTILENRIKKIKEVYFPDDYIGLCSVARLGGGSLGGLWIGIAPIEFDSDEDLEDESIYSYDDELNDFIESLTPSQYKKIVNIEEFEFPTKKSKTPGYLVWKSEETGMFLEGEIDVGKKFDIKKVAEGYLNNLLMG